jgi:Lrp/AsnC family leucine-responsive transcriptional regulator
MLDKTDYKIIAELQNNGRLSNQELSERIALSPSPCLRRVRQLEKSGVIKGYTAVVDQEACDLPIMAFITVRLDKQAENTIKIFEESIAELDEVMACYLMSGQSDYMLHVLNRSLNEYERFIRDRLTRIPGIGTLETHFAFGQVKQKRVFPGLES